jgi:hypothetical protein
MPFTHVNVLFAWVRAGPATALRFAIFAAGYVNVHSRLLGAFPEEEFREKLSDNAPFAPAAPDERPKEDWPSKTLPRQNKAIEKPRGRLRPFVILITMDLIVFCCTDK